MKRKKKPQKNWKLYWFSIKFDAAEKIVDVIHIALLSADFSSLAASTKMVLKNKTKQTGHLESGWRWLSVIFKTGLWNRTQ